MTVHDTWHLFPLAFGLHWLEVAPSELVTPFIDDFDIGAEHMHSIIEGKHVRPQMLCRIVSSWRPNNSLP